MRLLNSPFTASLITGGLMLFAAANTYAQNKTATWLTTNFQARTHYSVPVSDSMKYRLYVPVGYNPAQTYPIVVALHGIGERGFNNVNQLTLEELVQPWVRDSVQAKHPHFVMVPQCPTNQFWWSSNGGWSGNRSKSNLMIVEVLDSLKRAYSLDTTRFYAAGLSMGGFGTFELMRWNPDMFAAAVPTAGGGDTLPATITNHIKTPFWAFHGASDGTVNVSGSRNIVNRVEARGKAVVRFTSSANQVNPTAISLDSLRKAVYVDSADFLYSEVTGGNHAAGWLEAWRHSMVTDWVFSKRKGGNVVSLNQAVSSRPVAPAGVKVVLRQGRVLLEKTDALRGTTALYTVEGKRFNESGSGSIPHSAR
jgi:predicted peptidase